MSPYKLLFILLVPACLARADYPEIKQLDAQDVLYKQLQADIESYHKAVSSAAPPALPPLQFFAYINRRGLDLFALAARLNLPYDTLATLNLADSPAAFKLLERILIPNRPGIFVLAQPASTFQELLLSLRLDSGKNQERVLVADSGTRQAFLFYRGEVFHAIERAYFLNILFRYPLPSHVLTSRYGIRENPFTGSKEFHHGLDLAAPVGTEVLAARDGTVEEAGTHPVLGRYVLLQHEGGYQTVYGHLSSINVALQQRVASGMILGTVGNTGVSTGSHLHFEIRHKGDAKDPLLLLPRGKDRAP